MPLYSKLPTQRQRIQETQPGPVSIAGRVERDQGDRWRVVDETGSAALYNISAHLRSSSADAANSTAERVCEGDLVAIQGVLHEDRAVYVENLYILTRAFGPPPNASPSLEAIRARHNMMRTLRTYFHEEGFLEVETPNLVQAPGVDLHLEPFASRFTGFGTHPPRDLYLHTSPEFAMKKLLARGLERIVQFCKVWRNGERTALHNHEFTMAEWYRAYTSYEAVMNDVECVVQRILPTTLRTSRSTVSIGPEPFRRQTVCDAFRMYCNVDLLDALDVDSLRNAAQSAGLPPLCEGGSWDDLFHELLVTHIEPQLGRDRPTFLIDYPAQVAVLSRRRDDNPALAERFELYIDGVELCNGFTELNDPNEQRARFQEDLEARTRANLPPYPMPEEFLNALAYGMPPSSGVALGLDRLLMLSLSSQDIQEVLACTT